MAIMRIKSRLSASSPAPPPSPIPTAKGSRSATNSDLSSYIDKSKLIPELNLPNYIYRSVIADIDYASLKSIDTDSVDDIIRSATEFGVFRISNHGIPAEELRLTLTENEQCFRLLTECCRHYDHREEFSYCRVAMEALERGKRVVGVHKYRNFSEKIENVAAKLEMIAEELAQIIATESKGSPKKIQQNESKLSLCRHNYATPEKRKLSSLSESKKKSCKYALSLHLPLDHGEFCIKSEGGPLSFNTSSDTIVVTVGELLEEWSLGVYKSAHGELNFEPDVQGNQPSFSIELKCSPSSLNNAIDNSDKRISIANQVFLILIVILLYKLFMLIFT